MQPCFRVWNIQSSRVQNSGRTGCRQETMYTYVLCEGDGFKFLTWLNVKQLIMIVLKRYRTYIIETWHLLTFYIIIWFISFIKPLLEPDSKAFLDFIFKYRWDIRRFVSLHVCFKITNGLKGQGHEIRIGLKWYHWKDLDE